MATNPFDKALVSEKNKKSAAARARDAGAKALANAKEEGSKALAAAQEGSKKALARVRNTAHSAAMRAKEPIASVLQNEGVRSASHVGAFWLDAFIPLRGSKAPGFLNVIARPSTVVAAAGFGAAVFTKGAASFYTREMGQGAWHQVIAVFNRQIHDWLFGDSKVHDGMGDAPSSSQANGKAENATAF